METKEAYKAKFEARLDQAQAKLMALKASAKEKTAQGKIAMAGHIDTLEQGLAETKGKLAELAHASEDKWTEFKSSLEEIWAKASEPLKGDGPAANERDAEAEKKPEHDRQM